MAGSNIICANSCWLNSCKKLTSGTCHKSPDEFCQKIFRLHELFKDALLSDTQMMNSKMQLYVDADGTDTEPFKALLNIEQNIETFVSEGHNLYLFSPYAGNGKTSWAIRLVGSYFDKVWHKYVSGKALFINVPRFLLELKSSLSRQSDYIDHIKQNILSVDLVVWDDIGTKVGTEFELENLLSYINSRIDLGKSNIYTSNICPDKLDDVLGGRLYSRIVSMSTQVGLYGSDKRGLRV